MCCKCRVFKCWAWSLCVCILLFRHTLQGWQTILYGCHSQTEWQVNGNSSGWRSRDQTCFKSSKSFEEQWADFSATSQRTCLQSHTDTSALSLHNTPTPAPCLHITLTSALSLHITLTHALCLHISLTPAPCLHITLTPTLSLHITLTPALSLLNTFHITFPHYCHTCSLSPQYSHVIKPKYWCYSCLYSCQSSCYTTMIV